ncbi:MAG: hypothetical protein V4547_20175 [Bacteroidota bacterium]
MKRIKFLLLTFALTILIFKNISAQTTFNVPQNVELKADEDYAKYEKDIVAATKWLETIDLNKETEKRKETNAFVLKWITGSPTISISLTEQLQKIYGKNAELLLIYMASYASFFLENKSTATAFTATKAGLISIMNVYKKRIEISSNKEMDKLIKLNEEGKLDNYIKDKFN